MEVTGRNALELDRHPCQHRADSRGELLRVGDAQPAEGHDAAARPLPSGLPDLLFERAVRLGRLREEESGRRQSQQQDDDTEGGYRRGMQARSYTILGSILTIALLSGAARAESPSPSAMVFHAETPAGELLDTGSADREFNPASVVKVATTLWALEKLGAGHRFTTRFALRGSGDRSGRVDGDLVVYGGADPDFHLENAYLVARELNRAGVRKITGHVLVDDRFWIGWEGGSEKRDEDPVRRAVAMATAFRDTIDPARWSEATRKGVLEFRKRRGLENEPLPRVEVEGEGRGPGVPSGLVTLVVHRSNPLHVMLKRLNAYSNNDIERLGASLGEPADLARFLKTREVGATLTSLSGLGRNRMTCDGVTTLLRELQARCEEDDLKVEDLLPVNGCDPGTLENYRQLSEDDKRGAVTAKTGSLTETDGGVAALAGFARAEAGESLFCVALPGIGKRLQSARDAHERWLLALMEGQGGPLPGECGAPVLYSDDRATALFKPGASSSLSSRSTSSSVL